MQKMLALLADESKLTTTLENPSGELFVELDKEDENLAGLVLVRAPIVLDGKQVASVGVFGPQRMNYSAITAALKLVAEELKGGENVISEKDN
jgi:transcriptional regulator of heat shock response